MRVLKFSEFLLESRSSLLDGVQKFMDDGYKIKVLKKKDFPESDDVLLSDDSPHSYLLSHSGEKGGEIWIPKDVLDVKDEDGETFVFVHPEKKWLAKNSNRSSLEDFIESYIQSKIDFQDNESDFLEEIKNDIYIMIDILGVNLEISKVEKLGDKEYQIILKDGGCLDLVKSGRKNLFDTLKFYKSPEDGEPSVTIKRANGSHDFECLPGELGLKKFACNLDEVPKSPYYNFLLRKSLGKDTHGDGESLLNFFVDHVQKNPKSQDLNDDQESERRRFLKELKSVVSSYVSDDKLRSLLPSSI